MIYFSDQELDHLLLEDVARGDLTSHSLGLSQQPCKMTFIRKNEGIVAGVVLVEQLCRKLNLRFERFADDGEMVEELALLLTVYGSAEKLHHLWKVAQLVLEWSCGVAQYTAEMVANAKAVCPDAVVACTRKSIPNTRKLATNAVLIGGGHIHRQGLSESLLVFSNHRNLLTEPNNYQQIVTQLRAACPEHKVTLEADNLAQFEQILPAQPDIIQLDKFSFAQAEQALALAAAYPNVQLSIAGGVNKNNIADYAKLGLRLFITSAPYYAPPEDIKVKISAFDLTATRD